MNLVIGECGLTGFTVELVKQSTTGRGCQGISLDLELVATISNRHIQTGFDEAEVTVVLSTQEAESIDIIGFECQMTDIHYQGSRAVITPRRLLG